MRKEEWEWGWIDGTEEVIKMNGGDVHGSDKDSIMKYENDSLMTYERTVVCGIQINKCNKFISK